MGKVLSEQDSDRRLDRADECREQEKPGPHRDSEPSGQKFGEGAEQKQAELCSQPQTEKSKTSFPTNQSQGGKSGAKGNKTTIVSIKSATITQQSIQNLVSMKNSEITPVFSKILDLMVKVYQSENGQLLQQMD